MLLFLHLQNNYLQNLHNKWIEITELLKEILLN